MLNPRLSLRSAHFLPDAGLSAEYAISAKELWPLKVKRSLKLIRVRAGMLQLELSELPGLMHAEAVLITASECHLRIPGSQMALKHLNIRIYNASIYEKLWLHVTNTAAFAASLESLTIICKHSMGHSCGCRLSATSNLHTAMLAAGKKLNSNCRFTQPGGKKKPWSYGCWGASSGVRSQSMDLGEWAHAVRCCCHACLACLHRNGAAAFPEAIDREKAMFGP